ncbi:UNVERIFIED_CONTAM: hypothetical protein K2H54_047219 [Gekko kuhli]
MSTSSADIQNFFMRPASLKSAEGGTGESDDMVTETASLLPPPSASQDNDLAVRMASIEARILESMAALISPLAEQFTDFKLNLNQISQTAEAVKELSLTTQESVCSLWAENGHLKEKIVAVEALSHRPNLRFRGFAENFTMNQDLVIFIAEWLRTELKLEDEIISGQILTVRDGGPKKLRSNIRRSTETGIAVEMRNRVTRQGSRESTDGSTNSNSSDGTFIFPTTRLGAESQFSEFLDGLGPAQIVGRQTLATPPMGDVHIGMMDRNGQLEVEVIEARGLTPKLGSKSIPASYVKVYLLENGACLAKKKTKTAKKTCDPLYQQALLFDEGPQGKVLQVNAFLLCKG